MRISIVVAIIVLALSVGGQARDPTAGGSKRGQEVLAVIAKWAEAVRDRDVKALDAIFDDDVIITTFDGSTRGKAGELDALKPNPNVKGMSVSNEDVAIKLFGDVAVVTALTKLRALTKNGRENFIAMRYTAVLAKRDGMWRIVALQTVRAPQAAS